MDETINKNSYPIVTDAFLEIAKNQPHTVAFIDHISYTYGQLLTTSSKIANFIAAKHPSKSVIAVIGKMNFGTLSAIIGILRSGCVVLPIDIELPVQRQQLMLVESNAVLILQLSSLAINTTLPIYSVDPMTAEMDVTIIEPKIKLPEIDPRWPAYIFFTSGSTGKPKGILGMHAGLSHFIFWQKNTFTINQHDRASQITKLSFEVMLRDIFVPLCSGGNVIAANHWQIFDWFRVNKITITQLIPSLAKYWLQNLSSGTLPHLRLTFFAGEPLTDQLVNRWRQLNPAMQIVNLYGPAETTASKCYYVTENPAKSGIQAVGMPISETKITLEDKHGNLCKQGEIGEVIINTPYATLGYLDKSLNQGKFFQEVSAEQINSLYRTGDLGRFNQRGYLEICGRADHQIKLNGIRVELQEIEYALMQHEAINQAVVVLKPNAIADNILTAFICMKKSIKISIDVPQLRQFLAEALPIYMIPSLFVFKETLPLTHGGKIDRNLLQQEALILQTTQTIDRALTETEKKLKEMVKQIVKLKKIAKTTDLLSLGINSLSVMRLIIMIKEYYEINLNFRTIFENPCIQLLAQYIDGQHINQPKKVALAINIISENNKPSYAQQALIFFEQLYPNNKGVYNIPIALKFKKPLDQTALMDAVKILLHRHAQLNAYVIFKDNKPYLSYRNKKKLIINTIDLSKNSETEYLSYIENAVQTSFQLTRDPLLKIEYLQIKNNGAILLIIIHHFISDGWSNQLLLKELAMLYSAKLANKTLNNTPAPLAYAKYAALQHLKMKRGDYEELVAFWQNYLKNVPDYLIPNSNFIVNNETMLLGGSMTFAVSKALKTRLYQFAATNTLTPFMLLLSAYQILLHKHGNKNDFAVGIACSGRNTSLINDTIGYFANVIPVRSNIHLNTSIKQFLASNKENVLTVLDKAELPFEKIVTKLNITRSFQKNPIFQVAFVFDECDTKVYKFGTQSAKLLQVNSITAKFPLTLAVKQIDDKLFFTFEYAEAYFTVAAAQKLSENYLSILQAMLSNVYQTIANIIMNDAYANEKILISESLAYEEGEL